MDWAIRTRSVLLVCLGIVLVVAIHGGNAEQRIVCYYTNWSVYRPGTAKFSPQNINPYLCTHLIYAFGGFTKENTLKPFDKYQDIEKGGYAKFTGLKTYNKNLKTMLAIGGWNEGSSRFSPMVADAARRREFVKNSVKFLRQNHFDGLDLDWEYPSFRDGGKPRDRDNYASLVEELRAEFERESSKTGRPRLLLSMAMPAGAEYIDKGYDVPKLNEYLDFINLLSYDYHSAYEPAANHHAPLYPLEEDNEYNYDTELTINYTINHLLSKGASPEKLVLGIPTYGRSYTLFNEDATDLGAPADGPGIEGDATREKGYLAYYEICENIAESDSWEVVQPNPNAMGPYAFKGNQWVGYDDEGIVRKKAKYVLQRNLGGIMFWSIDNDDFRGKCHGRPYPLIEAAKEALLTGNSDKAKSPDSRKKGRPHGVQSNSISRKFSGSNRRTTSTTSTTTSAPLTRKRISNNRTKYRTLSRGRTNEDEENDGEFERRSYQSGSEDRNNDSGNAVRTVGKSERPKGKNKGRGRLRSSAQRKKESRKNSGDTTTEKEQDNLSNKLTTPEPPTTPDPGSDFKCEDEGFFPHPRDCKKYFWCLDSGPGGLGVVAHQFTCPSGLVFNKAADSCDYPRNVICPKSKAGQSTTATTRAPITAATSRTTYLYSTTPRTTTEKVEPEEEEEEDEEDSEYYDDEDEEDISEEEIPEPKVSSPKPLLYKTINRARPTTTTTTTTPPTRTTSTSAPSTLKVSEEEDEEDPRVIKELIDLIKKAGGIEQLEKQLLFQEKGSDGLSNNDEKVTPATISRTLYERVLSRQANKAVISQRKSDTSTSRNNYANGPGGAQFEGLEDLPEVKTLRRSQKPQYVTIERQRPSKKEPQVEEDEEDDREEDEEDDNTDVASSEEKIIGNPYFSSTQKATPNYVNIRRYRFSTTTSRNENDVDEKEDEAQEERPVRRRRPTSQSQRGEDPVTEQVSRLFESGEQTPTTKSRYVNIHHFRSTTPKSVDPVPTQLENTSDSSLETTTMETATESKPERSTQVTEALTTARRTSTSSSVTSSISTEITKAILTIKATDIVPSIESSNTNASSTFSPTEVSVTDSVKLVEDSATEILLTTVPARSSQSIPTTRDQGITTASISQPRPFGFPRRNRPPSTSSESTTTPLAPSKVANSEAIRLPTLKELVGYYTSEYATTSSPVYLDLLLHNERDDLLDIDLDREKENLEWYTVASQKLKDDGQSIDDLPRFKGLLYGVDGNDVEYESLATDEDNYSNGRARKTRIDHSVPLTTFRPTTMRSDIVTKKSLRGFYVTKSNTMTPSPTEVPVTDGENTEMGVTSTTSTFTGPTEASTIISTVSDEFNSVFFDKTTETYPTTVDSVTLGSTMYEDATSTQRIITETPPITLETTTDSGLTKSELSTLEIGTTMMTTMETTKPSATEQSSTESKILEESPQSKPSERVKPGRHRSRTRIYPSNYSFGHKLSRRPSNRGYQSESQTKKEESFQQRPRNQYPRQRIPVNRNRSSTGRRNGVKYSTVTTDSVTLAAITVKEETMNITSSTTSSELIEKIEERREQDAEEKEKFVTETVADSNVSDRIENVTHNVSNGEEARRRPSANESTTTETTEVIPVPKTTTRLSHVQRTPGTLLASRSRKPTTTASPPRSTLPTLSRRNEISETTISGKIGVTEVPNWYGKDVDQKSGVTDQSSRAQEIAVTLTDPPSSETPGTGRLPLKDSLRRRISTTIAPRTDVVTRRTTSKPSFNWRNRHQPRTKNKSPPPPVTTMRPRKPPIVDYDYYEDEDEPIVAKSTFNGKLFLTSGGTIRCLDQGNFPHPYSCKKFITCARMVNGLVVGTEYTCPDKLSFDPIGGICNWSAGLGCKE